MARNKWNRDHVKIRKRNTNPEIQFTKRPRRLKFSSNNALSTMNNNHKNHIMANAFNNLRFTTLATVMKRSITNLKDEPTQIDIEIHKESIG